MKPSKAPVKKTKAPPKKPVKVETTVVPEVKTAPAPVKKPAVPKKAIKKTPVVEEPKAAKTETEKREIADMAFKAVYADKLPEPVVEIVTTPDPVIEVVTEPEPIAGVPPLQKTPAVEVPMQTLYLVKYEYDNALSELEKTKKRAEALVNNATRIFERARAHYDCRHTNVTMDGTTVTCLDCNLKWEIQ